MSQDTDSKFIQEFQTKLDEMTKSNSTVNQKILSDLRDIQGKVSTILENIKSLQRKIVECNQKTITVNKQIQQNNQSIQSSAPPGQITELQKQNAELKQQLSVIDQTKKQAIDAIQKSIVVLDNYRNSSDTDVNSIKGLIDEIKAALMTASTAATSSESSGESGGILSGIMGLFGSSPAVAPLVPAPLVPPAAAVAPLVPTPPLQEQGPSVLERARAEEMEKQNRRVEERTRELQPQEKQQIIGDRLMAQGIENMQDRMKDRQITRDEQIARDVQRGEMFKELQQQRPRIEGGKKTRKSKKRSGNNKSKRRGKKRSPKKH